MRFQKGASMSGNRLLEIPFPQATDPGSGETQAWPKGKTVIPYRDASGLAFPLKLLCIIRWK